MNYTINGMVTDPEQINSLFGESVDTPEEETAQEEIEQRQVEEQQPQNKNTENIADEEDLTLEDMFGEEPSQERVGNDTEGTEREPSEHNDGSSPAKLYSSIANSLAEEGALSNLSEDDLKEVKDSETLIAAMKKQIDSMLDDTQKRIKSAIDAGMELPVIKQYEEAIQYLDSLTDEQISDESAQGEALRKRLIYQYQLSLGVSEERANKMVERAFAGGTDVEDAKDYLDALKTYYKDEYKKQIDEGKQAALEAKKRQEDDIKKFKNTLLKEPKILGDIEVDEKTRQLAFDNWIKPTHRNEQGVYQSAIQKYIAENPADFQMKVALLFTMTDGFTKMGNVLKQTVKKEKKKAMQDLEAVVNNTQRTPSGIINMKSSDANASFNGLQFAPPSSWK